MALINCPECGNECSTTAVSCPQCGHLFVRPVAQPRVVQEVHREDTFPKWIFIPIALLGVVALFVLFMVLRGDETDQRNVNVNIASTRQNERSQTSTTVPSTSGPSTVTTVPSTSQPSTVITESQTVETPSTITSVPSTTTGTTITESAQPDKSTVNIEAKILSRNSTTPQPVTKEKFYLLDKDLESILSEARIRDEGQGLVNTFGLAVVNPNKYGETNQKALAAINRHIVYSTTTDSSGKAVIKDVKPKNYYLFGITKTRNGFAVWSSPININPGQNSLVLDPVMPTEIVDSNQ